MPESEFGAAAALSADGGTALIGGPIDGADAGAAWVFVRPAVTPPGLPLPITATGTTPSVAAPAPTRPILSACSLRRTVAGERAARWRV